MTKTYLTHLSKSLVGIYIALTRRRASFFMIVFTIASALTVRGAVAQPLYEIQAISLPGQSSSTGLGISSSGNFVSGGSDASAVSWDEVNGTVELSPLATRPFNTGQDVNDTGIVAGIGATTSFGSSPLPVIWSDAASATQLPLPAGSTLGRAYSINNNEEVVGSVGGGSGERAATFTTVAGAIIAQTMPNGGVLTTAYANNDAGRIVGQATDPTNAAVTKGFYLDPGDGTATDIGALTDLGHNSAIAFAVSSNGLIAGSSSLNSGANLRAFVWSKADGMTEVPLLSGTSLGSARGVNADGWVVGNMSSATSIPFLYNGSETFALHDLLEPVSGTGWDIVNGTSNAAFDIGDNGVITGRGLLNGDITGFVMIPVPEPAGLMIIGLLGLRLLVRERRNVGQVS